jgi:hypothetical protein
MMPTEIRLAHWQGIELDYLIVLNYEKGLVAQNVTNLFLGLWVFVLPTTLPWMVTEIRLAHWQGIELDCLIILNYEKRLVAQDITNL